MTMTKTGDTAAAAAGNADSPQVGFGEATLVWLRLGLLSFGGPAAQIALMHRMLVEERNWLSENRFLHALNFCMLLPGPEAMQLATYAGWLMHGWRGGLVAGLLFVLPGAMVILVLAGVYSLFGEASLLAGVFFGFKAAVLAIVLQALLRISAKALKTGGDRVIAGLAFLAIFALAVPFPLIVLTAGLVGLLRQRAADAAEPAPSPASGGRLLPRSLGTLVVWGGLWLVPLAGLSLWLGGDHLLAQVGWFFSKLAVVTFGGAYAVLAYMAQQAVENHGWLTAPQMLDGLGLAETTPGPLILVTEFVGFLAGFGADADQPALARLLMGAAAAAVALWATFTPCFLWIFLGAPLVERLHGNPRLKSALASITAAVVGVILNLSVWFGLHVIFARVEDQRWGWLELPLPDPASIDPLALGLFALACALLFALKRGLVQTLLICSVAGVLASQV